MFLRKDNTLDWKLIWIASVITFVLVLLGIGFFDTNLYSWIHNSNCNVWNFSGGFSCALGVFIGKLFSAKMWLLVSGLFICYYIYKHHLLVNFDRKIFIKKLKETYASYVFGSVGLATIITGFLKVLIGRARPIFFDALDKVLFVPGSFISEFNSMPSGHATASFAGFVMLGLLFPDKKIITWTCAIIIGFSRIYIGAHWPTDVLLGALIGMISADVVKYVLDKRFK